MQSFPPVRDEIALSSRDSWIYFDVRRDGTVTRFHDFIQTPAPSDVMFCFRPGMNEWHWKDGWLPILCIGSRFELAASGDELIFRDGGTYHVFPGNRPIDATEFSCRCDEIATGWCGWFRSGIQLPALSSRLEAAWKSSLIQARCMFAGRHPSYGSHHSQVWNCYRQHDHDAFPPATLTMAETLLQFGHGDEAADIFCGYFERYGRADGEIDYYGVSLAEYGMTLWCGAMLMREVPGKASEIAAALYRLIRRVFAHFVRSLLPENLRPGVGAGLLSGSPEADEKEKIGQYFHNNAQIWRGFRQLAPELRKLGDLEAAAEMFQLAEVLAATMKSAFEIKHRELGCVPYSMEQTAAIVDFQRNRECVYANYRYYPELLESAWLSPEDACECFARRENSRGEYAGMTLFSRRDGLEVTDNWPLGAYARALLEYGQRERFMRLLETHFKNYISDDTFTAYEQVTVAGSPRVARAAACVPVQLLLPRMLGWSFSYRKWNGEAVNWGGPQNMA